MLLVIGAMPEELEACHKAFDFQTDETVLGPIFRERSNKFLLCTSGIGLTNASARLSQCLTLYPEISQILVLGTTGAVTRNLHQGDIVLVPYTIYGFADVRAFGYELGQIPQMPPVYEANHHFLKLLEQHFSSKVERFSLVNCASLDVFVDNENQVREWLRPLPIPVQIVDMELAAYYQVAFRFHKPILALKIVSDSLMHEKNPALSFDEFLPTASEKLKWCLEEIIRIQPTT
ncbi:adenosylhomocysteine nucleosidase [Entomoplasma freundtii]|uniref:adenosylhomocysteine nucleosidase n=1 Tax=Entomoplasma freundtii TaxID=74700 RepID=A0A2K8NRI3_9MOLU|nr:5'-methylthioadenosine/S-adenosylhomocysteine nucleosidase [Entomoplasma freundtii]ATZ16462.1 5'-methylthioadenosine/S-adenosylhomocysteine nucleosidase [Entomoplasma freundtii]TDY55991.1 adenosylhomocysteine nucleosidase [Entomoplasma freundtii]